MSTAVVAAAAAAATAGIVAALALGRISNNLRPGLSGTEDIVVFVLLASTTSVSLVIDDACVGLRRAGVQLRRNVVFAAVKLALVPVLASLWRRPGGTELVIAWLVGTAVSLVFAARTLLRATEGQADGLVVRTFIGKRRVIAAHHWLNVSIQAPRLLIPVLITVIIGPAINAAYTTALLAIGVVNIIPVHLSTALFALAPGDEQALGVEVRRSMKICTAIAAVSAFAFAVGSGWILRVFRPDYLVAAGAMRLLGLTTLPIAFKTHYVAIARVRGHMARAARVAMAGGLVEIVLTAIGANVGGATGAGGGFLLATVIEGVAFAPVVVGVLRRSTPRRPEFQAAWDELFTRFKAPDGW